MREQKTFYMNLQGKMKAVLLADLIILIGTVTAIAVLSPEKAVRFRLFEILGASAAAALTVFGLKEMKQLTSD